MQNLTEHDSLEAWLEYIAGIHVSAIDMGLERVLPIIKKLGISNNDLNDRPYIFTVAGTNGKGSTTATIAQICQCAGFRTALYQSPHLISFTERIKIDGVAIDESDLVQALVRVEQARLECQVSLSFFEMTTLAAFLIFKESNVDVWVLEIGLGGRLDVVNAIEPDLAVITNIGIDHVDWLGDDIEKIGMEKAGIIRKNIPVILGARDLPNSIFEVIEANDAKAYQIGKDYEFCEFCEQSNAWQYSSQGITLNLPKPKLSLLNAVNAVSAVLASDLPINENAIKEGLVKVTLAGRFDHRMINGKRWLFDVAHNAHGMKFLLEQFVPYWQSHKNINPNAKLNVVFSMLGDKDIGAVLDLVQGELDQGRLVISTWHIAAIDHVRAMPLDDILTLVHHHLKNPNAITHDSLDLAVRGVMQKASEQDLILVFGSFHTVGEVLMVLLG